MFDCVSLAPDEAEVIIAFIKSHEREDIPDVVLTICEDMCKELGIQ